MLKLCRYCGLSRICTLCLEDQVIEIVGSPLFISVRFAIEKLARVCCISYEDAMVGLIDVKNFPRT